MPKRKEPELTPAEQFKRFKETVKKLEVDESGKELERAFKKVASGTSKTKQR
jgi:hypothetical protein